VSRVLRFVVACAWAWASYGHPAQADDYPGKPIKIIIAQAAGGASDVLVRLLAQKLTENLGQQVVIENRPGAGANIGAEIAARSAPDGYTIFVASLPHAIAPSLYKNLSYDLLKDFAPIALAAEEQFCLVVHPSLPATNVKDFIAFLKRHSGAVSYGSTGNGAANHLAMELLQSMAGVKLVHVPYRGSSFALTDAINGRVPVLFVNLSPVSGHLQSGKLRALAVTALKRSPLLPAVPTIDESGYPGYDIVNWFGFLAPAGTPADIIRKLNSVITKVAGSSEIKGRLALQGAEPLTATPEEMRAFLSAEITKWDKVVRATGARVD
jgi:tripartite-type tricarboxylate transporter receptor subunit TctC